MKQFRLAAAMSTYWFDKMGPEDDLFYGTSLSFFMYEPAKKFLPVVPRYVDINAVESSITFSAGGGETINFIPTYADRRLAEVCFTCKLSAMTAATGTYNKGTDILCYHQDIAHRLFQTAKLMDGSLEASVIYPDLDHFMEEVKRRNDRRTTDEEWGLFDSQEDLNDVARAEQEIFYCIPFPFSTSLDRALRLDNLQGHDIRFRFTLNPKGYLWYTNDAGITDATFTMTQFKLIATYYPLTKPERSQEMVPVTMRWTTVQKKAEYRITSSMTTFSIPIEQFSYCVAAFVIRVRPDISAGDRAHESADNWWTCSEEINTIGLDVDGNIRYDPRPVKWWTRIIAQKHWPSLPMRNGWVILPLCIAPMRIDEVATGSLNMSMCHAANINMTMSSGVNGYVDIWAITYNLLSYVIEGSKCYLKLALV